MIAYLKGTLLLREGDSVVIVAGGVGYELRLPLPALEPLGLPGSPAEVWVHTNVREDAIDLYGFSSPAQRALFRLLIGAPKVGPSLALLVMSAVSPADLSTSVRSGDTSRLTRVKGIGKKTAETLLFNLKDKVLEIAASGGPGPPGSPGSDNRKLAYPVADELISALLALGYRPAQAEAGAQAARQRAPDAGLAGLVREALNVLQRL
jgi:Holliday junction DNA helicase RuvA